MSRERDPEVEQKLAIRIVDEVLSVAARYLNAPDRDELTLRVAKMLKETLDARDRERSDWVLTLFEFASAGAGRLRPDDSRAVDDAIKVVREVLYPKPKGPT